MTIEKILVSDFSKRLVTSDQAIDFKKNYLALYNENNFWENPNNKVYLDFSGVEKISPVFISSIYKEYLLNEGPHKVLNKITPINYTPLQKEIIDIELGIKSTPFD